MEKKKEKEYGGRCFARLSRAQEKRGKGKILLLSPLNNPGRGKKGGGKRIDA